MWVAVIRSTCGRVAALTTTTSSGGTIRWGREAVQYGVVLRVRVGTVSGRVKPLGMTMSI